MELVISLIMMYNQFSAEYSAELVPQPEFYPFADVFKDKLPRQLQTIAACESVALRYATKLHQWYQESRTNISLLSPRTREALSHHFNHLLALFYRSSLWNSTNGSKRLATRPSLSTLFRPISMVLYRSRYGGSYVGLFKHPLELSITAAVRIRRYSKLKGDLADMGECWNMVWETVLETVLKTGWKHLKLREKGSDCLRKFHSWATSNT